MLMAATRHTSITSTSCARAAASRGSASLARTRRWRQHGYKPQNVAGTSAGAITAALIAAGYTSAELDKIIFGLDYRQFEDESWEDRIPLIGTPPGILFNEGVYKGEVFLEWIRALLAAKGVHTFADLRTDSDDPKYRSKLQVIASDISARQLLVLPRDAAVLGFDPDELEVALAVRMSMSIPIFFEAVRHVNEQTNHEHVIVDGGMLSNFPVWLFDCGEGEVPEWPTFGLLLVEPDPKIPITERIPEPEHGPHGFKGLVALASSMVHTMMEAHDRLYLEKAQFARTISIPTLGCRDDGVRPPGRQGEGACTSPAARPPRVPRDLGLPGLHRAVPQRQDLLTPRGHRSRGREAVPAAAGRLGRWLGGEHRGYHFERRPRRLEYISFGRGSSCPSPRTARGVRAWLRNG